MKVILCFWKIRYRYLQPRHRFPWKPAAVASAFRAPQFCRMRPLSGAHDCHVATAGLLQIDPALKL
jgi:hypothetical protein